MDKYIDDILEETMKLENYEGHRIPAAELRRIIAVDIRSPNGGGKLVYRDDGVSPPKVTIEKYKKKKVKKSKHKKSSKK